MLDRRNFIAATGGITVISMAGCIDSEDSSNPDAETTDGPAEFAVYGTSLVDAGPIRLTHTIIYPKNKSRITDAHAPRSNTATEHATRRE